MIHDNRLRGKFHGIKYSAATCINYGEICIHIQFIGNLTLVDIERSFILVGFKVLSIACPFYITTLISELEKANGFSEVLFERGILDCGDFNYCIVRRCFNDSYIPSIQFCCIDIDYRDRTVFPIHSSPFTHWFVLTRRQRNVMFCYC